MFVVTCCTERYQTQVMAMRLQWSLVFTCCGVRCGGVAVGHFDLSAATDGFLLIDGGEARLRWSSINPRLRRASRWFWA